MRVETPRIRQDSEREEFVFVEENISHRHDASDEREPMRSIIHLAHRLFAAPVALWAASRGTKEILLLASAGLPKALAESSPLKMDSADIVARVHRIRRREVVTELSDHIRYLALPSPPKAVLILPIGDSLRGAGVLEIFDIDGSLESAETDAIDQIERVMAWTLEARRSAEEAELFEDLVARIRAHPGIDQIMNSVMSAAQDLTGADSAAIILRDLDDQEFIVAHRVPSENSPKIMPRSEGGLTAEIIRSGAPVLVADNRKNRKVARTLQDQGFLSMAGVPIELHGERFGALFVDSRSVGQFDRSDLDRLERLAGHASTSLGWSRKLLRPHERIETATSKLSHLGTIVDDVCESACRKLGFDFAAAQLIRRVENIIETVGGYGLGKQWVGISRHYLHEAPGLRDIQADVALSTPLRLEILSGWDDRFDRWLYERNAHDELVRVIAPLVVVRLPNRGAGERGVDDDDRVVDDWAQYATLRETLDQADKSGHRKVLEIDIRRPDGRDFEWQVIGTLEVGFANRDRRVDDEHIKALIPFLAKSAVKVYRALLPSVLRTILKNAQRIVRASSASLHLYRREEDEKPRVRYVHEVTAGDIKMDFLEDYPPRPDGLGSRAHEAGRALVIPSRSEGHAEDQLRQMNPDVWEAGIRAIVAVPLTFEEENKSHKAVLYLHFREERWIQDDELGWLQLFARRASDAIQQATLFERTRDRANQFKAIEAVARALSTKVSEGGLLGEISNNVLNILAADVVTIYEYDDNKNLETEKRFIFPPATAGRLLSQGEMGTAVKAGDAPTLLVELCERMQMENEEEEEAFLHFAPEVKDDPVCFPHRRREPASFVERERIRSAVGVLLKVHSEIVAVMFINYRRPHKLGDHEKSLIQSLAATAAISIKNRRMLEAWAAGGRELVDLSEPEQVLANTVKRAVQLTRAEMGFVRLLDPDGKLVLSAQHPADFELANEVEIGGGLSGWVAQQRQPRIVENAGSSSLDVSIEASVRAALCLPLLGEGGHVIGVLGVGSSKPGAFSASSQWLLRGLADHATLALLQVDLHRQKVASETMAAFGQLTGDFFHLASKQVGWIRLHAKRILDRSGPNLAPNVTKAASAIVERSDVILAEAENLKRTDWNHTHAVAVSRVMEEALEWTEPGRPRHVTVGLDIPTRLPFISGSDDQLRSIFINLIENAYRAVTEQASGELEICAMEQVFGGRSWVIVTFRDNGVGIPPEYRHLIFEPGISLSTTGLGYGLWLSKMYIERSHGRIEVKSEVGAGTQFRLWLPKLIRSHESQE